MSDRVIDAISQETLRLVQLQQDQLRGLLRTPHLLKESTEGKRQNRSVTRNDADLWIQTLADEAVKVGRLEMTLAVIGTMKAGKSTTINAIVGAEVLPNRNHPMTTLPTVIRHTPGQLEPVLTFAKPEPFNRAIKSLRTVLQKMERERQLPALLAGASKDEQGLVAAILSGRLKAVADHHAGSQAIFEFLKALNDISRLCHSLSEKVESPLTGYTSIDEFPVISVEFFHLRGTEGQGRFSLIDTPGPNEAGQVHLGRVMGEQLAKASAVLAVADYTQLNTQADHDVREQLIDLAGNRLFVLVNKFDQKGTHGMGAEDVKAYMAGRLFDEKISTAQVYPVSSRYAYLAKRAQRELELYGRVPVGQPWVEEFGQLALGAMWESRIEDRADVERSAAALWKASRFESPIAEVIVRASSHAAFISLDAATDKMEKYDQLLLQLLDLRSKAATSDLVKIRKHITSLEADIATIGEARDRARKEVSSAIGGLRKKIATEFAGAHDKVGKLVTAFFKAGKIEEQKREEAMNKLQTGFVISLLAPKRRPITWDPNEPNTFTSRDEAVQFVNDLNSELQEIVGPRMVELEKAAAEEVKRLQAEMWPRINTHVGAVLKKAEVELKESFNISFNITAPTLGTIAVDFDAIQLDAVHQETRTVTRYHQKRAWWKLWLGTVDVPYESTESVYKVHTKEMGKNVQAQLKTSGEQFEKTFDQYVKTQLGQQIEDYFAAMTTFLDRFRGDLLDAMENSKLETAQLQQLMQAMESELVRVRAHLEDVTELRRGLRSLE